MASPAKLIPCLVIATVLCCLPAACTISSGPGLVPENPSRLPPPGLPNGIAAGDVTQDGVVLWTRAAAAGTVTFTVEAAGAPVMPPLARTVDDPLIPVTVTIAGLSPATAYDYWVTAPNGDGTGGKFRTPAEGSGQRGLRFGASGDVRGSLAPYPAIGNVPARDLDFFLGLGDSIYADFSSPAVPKQAQTEEEFLRKYAEVIATHRDVNTLAALRSSTITFATIDDHEVLNNFSGGAPSSSSRYFAESSDLINQTRLYRAGLRAFFLYHPLRHETYGSGDARMAERPKLYRYRTFGADAALFMLDTRSFRDEPLPKPTATDDDDAYRFFEQLSFDPTRTMLGEQQLTDLQRDLLDAQRRDITWKFVITSVPIQQLDPTSAEDRWQGYAAERARLLNFVAAENIDNVVFIAADIHGTVVNNLAYRTEAQGAFVPVAAWEITVGPVAAYAPYGLSMFWHYEQLGLLSEAEVERFWSLPAQPDSDELPDDRDDFVRGMLNQQMLRFGYSPFGLDDAKLDVELLDGDYFASQTYGWSEFAIDADTQALTVTTYGITPYREEDLATHPHSVLAREPSIVSRFVVKPAQ